MNFLLSAVIFLIYALSVLAGVFTLFAVIAERKYMLTFYRECREKFEEIYEEKTSIESVWFISPARTDNRKIIGAYVDEIKKMEHVWFWARTYLLASRAKRLFLLSAIILFIFNFALRVMPRI